MAGEQRMDTALKRVLNHGAAGDGVGHWWGVKVSSVALLPLTVLFVLPFATTVGGGHEAMKALYAQPFHAVVATLFVAVSFWHLRQGLQVVIEDYVHDKWPRTTLLLANTLGCAALGVAGVFAILKLAFGA